MSKSLFIGFFRLFILFISFTFVSHYSFAQDLMVQTDTVKVDFFAIGQPSFLKIHGKSEQLNGKIQIKNKKLTASFQFPLNTLNTGIKLRDKHMKKKYLETKAHPNAVFEVKSWDIPNADQLFSTGLDTTLSGTLTIRKIPQKVDVQLQLTPEGKNLKVLAKLKTKISDFNIELPSFMGITVAEDIDLQIAFDAATKEK